MNYNKTIIQRLKGLGYTVLSGPKSMRAGTKFQAIDGMGNCWQATLKDSNGNETKLFCWEPITTMAILPLEKWEIETTAAGISLDRKL
jgi:hypothetical protein